MGASTRTLVEQFYNEVWNKANEPLAYSILTPDFRFRGSLGAQHTGPGGFISYTRQVHTALGNYECIIEELMAADDRAAAKMLFRGVHQGLFFGVEATHSPIEWAGAAFFQMRGGQIAALWVLGDIDNLKRQLADAAGRIRRTP